MVKLRPDKLNLEEDYTAHPTIFKNMGIYLGDVFENRKKETLKVKKKNNEKWYLEKIEP